MSWLSNLLKGGKNPANSAMPYLDQIPGQTKPYFEPYVNRGNEASNLAKEQYDALINRPGQKLNDIGNDFHESPGFKWAMEQALQGTNNLAAAHGMAGSPEHEQQNMTMATNLANQDYNDWLKQATGMYNTGLTGEQHQGDQGLEAGKSLADMIAQTLAQQGNLAFQGQAQKNQNQSNLFGTAAKGLGAAFGAGNPLAAFANFFGGGH